MTDDAREHAQRAAQLIGGVNVGRPLDRSLAHALTAIALALTEKDEDLRTTTEREADEQAAAARAAIARDKVL